MVSQKPNFANFKQDFTKLLKEKCSSKNPVEMMTEQLDDNELEMLLDTPTSHFKFDIRQKIIELKKLFICMRDVIGTDVKGSDLKNDYDQFKLAVDAVLKNDMGKCRDLTCVNRFSFTTIECWKKAILISIVVEFLQLLFNWYEKT